MPPNDNKKETKDTIDELLRTASDRPSRIDPQPTSAPPVMDDQLDFSEEDVEKARTEAMDKIESHIDKMKENVDNGKLAEYMLDNRIVLLEQGKFMLNEFMVTIMTTLSSNARAFEVLTKMLSTVANINDTIVHVNEDKKKTAEDVVEEENMVGSSTDIIESIVKKNIKEFVKREKDEKEDVEVVLRVVE